jgi:ubiquinone/menaquinone biosynthesis C-methylase UbiE
MSRARRAVDLGTGGGERFAEIVDGQSGFAVATEEWVVNAPVAGRRLSPLGIRIVRCNSTMLPFRDDCFDLMLSRHEAIDPFEVSRILSPGGTFLTQQVENTDWIELRDFFGRWQSHGDHWAYYRAGLIASGLTVVNAIRHYETVWFKFEELVAQLCVMPWTIADFAPLGRDLDALLELEGMCSAEGEVELTEGRYLIEASLTP